MFRFSVGLSRLFSSLADFADGTRLWSAADYKTVVQATHMENTISELNLFLHRQGGYSKLARYLKSLTALSGSHAVNMVIYSTLVKLR